ncbi:MAG: DUF2062 domain-containing protein [Rhodospirillaceae bacterium]|nr:DUF2062 domain-containing protein [Rhodospirillaceae bacterium]
MFQRRSRPNIVIRLREFFWPSSGWHRSTRYVFHRVARIPGSSYSIAAGFACGAAISMTPFVGLHFVLSAIVAYIMRANILASAIGTAVGNPWTFPFIWVWIYNAGIWIVGSGHTNATEVDFATVFSTSMEALIRFDIAYLVQTSGPVLWPMLIGSIPTAIVTWIIFYAPLQPIISRYQAARHHRRTRKKRRKEKNKEEQSYADEKLAAQVSSDVIPNNSGVDKT